MDDTEIDTCIDGYGTDSETHHQVSNQRIDNKFSNMDDSNCTSTNDAEKSEEPENLLRNASADQVYILRNKYWIMDYHLPLLVWN